MSTELHPRGGRESVDCAPAAVDAVEWCAIRKGRSVASSAEEEERFTRLYNQPYIKTSR